MSGWPRSRFLRPGCCGLIHLLLSLVPIARNDVVFQGMMLLILHLERLPFVVHQFHSNLAIAAVLLGIRRRVVQNVLITNGIIDGMENNQYRVLVGKDAKFMDFIYRLKPTFAAKFISSRMKAILEN